jgi:pyruvate dehydrogenase E2 component (dihydrolipoamide acetyltransferase)
MRLATARLMARSAREIPHYYVSTTVDVRPMTTWLAAHNAGLPVRRRVLPVALLLKAACRAATVVPELNGHWIDEAFVPGDGVQLGVATATRGGGLVTPALRDAHALDADALMAALADLIRRARKGSLRSSEIAPGTLTVSSLADGGPDALFGVIYPPQVALVGIGALAERPWAVDGMLTVRPTVTITLAADHRASDGRTGAAFLAAMTDALQQPEEP